MNKTEKKFSLTTEALESQSRSREFLRIAKQMAEKSHQAAVLAKKNYKTQQKALLNQNQRG